MPDKIMSHQVIAIIRLLGIFPEAGKEISHISQIKTFHFSAN
jgi:hypothetical protein